MENNIGNNSSFVVILPVTHYFHLMGRYRSASNDYDTDGIDTYHYQKLEFPTMILTDLTLTSTFTVSFYEEDCVIDHTSPFENRKTNTNS